MDCTQVALLTLKEYESIRSGGRQGLAVLGHEDPTIEGVLERNERFVMTEVLREKIVAHSLAVR